MEPEHIEVLGAREHNLKALDLKIPKKQFVVLTGPSGSGKSSLAIDTIYTEGRRRFVESLSAYARQFLGQKEKPKFDKIHGLSPTIAVEQKSASTNPRSTVGTITEILDYLRVLFARLGVQHCPGCGQEVRRQSAQQIVNWISSRPEKTRLILLAPILVNRKGEHRDVLKALRAQGFVRARDNGEMFQLDERESLDKKHKHSLEVVVDRLVVKADEAFRSRLADSVESALRVGEGRLIVSILDKDESGAERSKDTMLSERLACEACERSFPDLSPQSFSFNSPQGMCAACNGLGHRLEFDPQLIVPNPEKSVLDGAIKVWSQRTGDSNSFTLKILEGFAQAHGIDLKKPWSELADEDREHILRGSRKKFSVGLDGRRFKGEYQTAFEGIIPMLERRFQQTQSEGMRQFYAGFMSDKPCDGCQGLRLREESRHVLVAGHSLTKLCEYSVREVSELFERLMDKIDSEQRSIGAELVKEVRARLRFLTNVGLDYLSLNRKGPTLSGGESQRIQLASQLGSELSGVIYVLDEPSIGLHTRDARKLIDTLQNLRDLGNSVLVVEHDRDTIEAADWLIDFGPGAGTLGGQVTAAGTPAELADDPNSLTGLYLSHRRRIEGPAQRRVPKTGHKLTLRGARANNLRNVDVEVPLSLFVCVTGVSGAGKSTLINQVLLPAATRKLHGAQVIPGEHDSLDGLEKLDKVIAIDQQPIGRTPRSNPATYVKVWDEIRSFFAELNESKAFGFGPGRFSFNVKGGRCEGCQGSGVKKVEMHFLPDVFVICQECNGKRFNDATLRVRYQGRNIAEILDLTVDEAAQVFDRHPNIKRLLTTLQEVGLGYISLGQQSPSLSGGEAQRVKLARELSRKQTGRTFYVLDEPSTGLHFEDIKKLLSVLQRLVESGNSVLVIEHNLDIIKTADWLIDVGPEGGSGGGKIVATGTPELVAHCKESYTGQVLAELFEAEAKIEAPVSKVKGSKIKASQAKTTQAKASQAETSNGKPSKSKTANSKKKPAPSKSRKVPSKT